mgnify:FL=1
MPRSLIQSALAASVMLAAASAGTQDASRRLHIQATAATCANCHGTNGRTVDGSAIPALAGMPRAYMLMQMQAFRDGSRPATVMHQITKGLTQEQVDQVADYFAAAKR